MNPLLKAYNQYKIVIYLAVQKGLYQCSTMLSFTVILILLVLSFCFGILGALLGLGGGIFIVPILTIYFNIPIQYAIGASAISVIATSSGAAAAYLRDKITNMRIAMFLEMGTTTGAITGAYLAGIISIKFLYIVFCSKLCSIQQ